LEIIASPGRPATAALARLIDSALPGAKRQDGKHAHR